MNDIVERLEQDCYCSDLSDGKCVPCQARTEIERLRTDYELLSSDYKELLGDNERLRERVCRITEQRDGLLIGLDQKDGDIERLRGALVLYLDTIRLIREGKPVPVDFLEKRVCEALGDE